MKEKRSGYEIRKERSKKIYLKIRELYDSGKTVPEIREMVKKPDGKKYAESSIRQCLYILNQEN